MLVDGKERGVDRNILGPRFWTALLVVELIIISGRRKRTFLVERIYIFLKESSGKLRKIHPLFGILACSACLHPSSRSWVKDVRGQGCRKNWKDELWAGRQRHHGVTLGRSLQCRDSVSFPAPSTFTDLL